MDSVLIIGHTWPEPKTTGAGVRMMQLIKCFQNRNFNIHFASTAEKTNYSHNLENLGVTTRAISLNNASFDDFLKEIKPDVVLFDRFYTEEQFGWRVAETLPKAIRVLDTEDLHFLRFAREEAVKKNSTVNYKNSEIAVREIASIYRCDLSLIISKKEMEILETDFKVDAKLLHYLPFLPDAIQSQSLPEFEQRYHIVFIGNYKHQPNVDAVRELKTTIWPLLSSLLPQVELHCYGAYAPQHLQQLQNPKERFFVKGWVEDAIPVIARARVMLAPLRFGAGLKGKFLDAMQCGTPFVTTKIGIEGFEMDTDGSTYISDNPQDFAEKAAQLYEEKYLWQSAQKEGFAVLNRQFLNTNREVEFFEVLEELAGNLSSHRENNFTGAMLLHHTMQSTKYLSKWIEAKNQRDKSR